MIAVHMHECPTPKLIIKSAQQGCTDECVHDEHNPMYIVIGVVYEVMMDNHMVAFGTLNPQMSARHRVLAL